MSDIPEKLIEAAAKAIYINNYADDWESCKKDDSSTAVYCCREAQAALQATFPLIRTMIFNDIKYRLEWAMDTEALDELDERIKEVYNDLRRDCE